MKRKRLTTLAIIALFAWCEMGAVSFGVTPQIPPSFPHPRSRLIPVKVKLALIGVVMLAGAGTIALALRQAKRAHFFTRSYQFRAREPIAPRLGAQHCGGFVVMRRFKGHPR